MAFVDGTAVNVAMPALQASFGASVTGAQWVVEAYALFLAGLLLVGGALGDRYGRRRVFAIGVAAFAAASAWCGFAPSLAQLVAARSLQGAAAALLVPGSLALLSAAYSRERLGRAIGTWSGATAITATLGPLVGGWLVDHASWRWVFFLNLPLAAAVLLLCRTKVPESRDPEAAPRLDTTGALLATAGLGGMTFGLLTWPRLGPRDPQVWLPLVGGILALAGFLAVEARARAPVAPMMPLSLFRSKNFAGANLLTLFLYAGLGGALFFFPFDLVQVQGYSTTAAGAAFLPFILITSTLSRWAGGLVQRYGARLPLIVGPAVAALGFALFARPGVGGSYWTTFFPAVVVLGLGMATAIAPLTTTVMGSVEVRHAGVASGINNAVSRVASLLAVAVCGIVLVAGFESGRERRLARLPLPPATRQALDRDASRLAAAPPPSGLSPDLQKEVRRALNDSFVDGFRRAMLLAAGLALLSAVAAAVLIEGRPGSAQQQQ
jgi:EmrB/QacA subfamily drug resistance transporter